MLIEQMIKETFFLPAYKFLLSELDCISNAASAVQAINLSAKLFAHFSSHREKERQTDKSSRRFYTVIKEENNKTPHCKKKI